MSVKFFGSAKQRFVQYPELHIINQIPRDANITTDGRALLFGQAATTRGWAFSASYAGKICEFSWLDENGTPVSGLFEKTKLCDPEFCETIPVCADPQVMAAYNARLISTNLRVVPHIHAGKRVGV